MQGIVAILLVATACGRAMRRWHIPRGEPGDHIGRAADALRLTQPAVSGHVKALEARLQLKLFERTPSGIRLTRAGESLLPHARAVLAAEDHFKISSKRLLSRKAVAARLGTILDPEFLRIGKLLAAILEKHPWIEIELQHGITTWATDKLLKGELDAAKALLQVILGGGVAACGRGRDHGRHYTPEWYPDARHRR